MSATTSEATGAPSAQNLTSSITSAIGGGDVTASDRVQTLSLVHRARVTQLTRSAAAAAAQYGANSTQAAAAKNALAAATATSARVALFKQQVTTPAPQVTATGWVLHGRVVDAQLQPVAGATVYLVDAQNSYQPAYGFGYTDRTGYYQLTGAGAAPEASVAANDTATAVPSLYLAVVNAKAQPVYLGATAVPLARGTASYRTIALAAGQAPIGDPPEAIRKLALPPEDGET